MIVPRTAATAYYRGLSVNIITWVTLIAVCLATVTKIGLKYSNIRGFGWDDAYILGAMVRSILFHYIPSDIGGSYSSRDRQLQSLKQLQ